jgi:hypothetical protein
MQIRKDNVEIEKHKHLRIKNNQSLIFLTEHKNIALLTPSGFSLVRFELMISSLVLN